MTDRDFRSLCKDFLVGCLGLYDLKEFSPQSCHKLGSIRYEFPYLFAVNDVFSYKELIGVASYMGLLVYDQLVFSMNRDILSIGYTNRSQRRQPLKHDYQIPEPVDDDTLHIFTHKEQPNSLKIMYKHDAKYKAIIIRYDVAPAMYLITLLTGMLLSTGKIEPRSSKNNMGSFYRKQAENFLEETVNGYADLYKLVTNAHQMYYNENVGFALPQAYASRVLLNVAGHKFIRVLANAVHHARNPFSAMSDESRKNEEHKRRAAVHIEAVILYVKLLCKFNQNVLYEEVFTGSRSNTFCGVGIDKFISYIYSLLMIVNVDLASFNNACKGLINPEDKQFNDYRSKQGNISDPSIYEGDGLWRELESITTTTLTLDMRVTGGVRALETGKYHEKEVKRLIKLSCLEDHLKEMYTANDYKQDFEPLADQSSLKQLSKVRNIRVHYETGDSTTNKVYGSMQGNKRRGRGKSGRRDHEESSTNLGDPDDVDDSQSEGSESEVEKRSRKTKKTTETKKVTKVISYPPESLKKDSVLDEERQKLMDQNEADNEDSESGSNTDSSEESTSEVPSEVGEEATPKAPQETLNDVDDVVSRGEELSPTKTDQTSLSQEEKNKLKNLKKKEKRKERKANEKKALEAKKEKTKDLPKPEDGDGMSASSGEGTIEKADIDSKEKNE